MNDGYKPQKMVAEILDWALQKVKSVPYEVSLRWLFYQVLQEKGLTKDSYKKFISYTATARKRFWNGWNPTTLVDDSREILFSGSGYASPRNWVESFKEYNCILDKRHDQESITVIMFEAQAMRAQFEHYSVPFFVTLVPFKGDASINLKWKIAKWLEQISAEYHKPINVLYFGDLDPKGLEIPENAMRDIRSWCSAPFNYKRIGLTQEHIDRWYIPDNPERPGQYQWEALSDVAAKELIEGTLIGMVNLTKIHIIRERETEAKTSFCERLDELLDQYYPEEDST